MLGSVEPDVKLPAKDMQKFLAFVGVRFAAAAARLDAKEMRLHCGVAPGEKLHAHAGVCFQDFSLAGANEAGIVAGSFEKRQNIRAVKACDAAQSRNGGAHLAAFQCAEETDGYAGGARDLRERKAAPRP